MVDVDNSRAPLVIVLERIRAQDATGFIVRLDPGRPAYEGNGEVDYACPTCGGLICRNVRRGLFAGVVFHCPCGTLSRLADVRPRLSPFE